MSLPEFSTRYPVTIAMATFAVVLLGWISLDGLGTDLLPNVQTPVITVDLQVPGKSPQEMEERYTRRLERDIAEWKSRKAILSEDAYYARLETLFVSLARLNDRIESGGVE